MDDFVNKVTNQGKFWRSDWNKITGAVAYAAGRWYDLSPLNGTPVANTFAGTALAAQIPNEASTFSPWNGGDVSPDTKHLTNIGAYTAVATAVPGVLMYCDMVAYYPGISMNVATAQTLTNAAALTRYTSGAGLRAALVINTSSGATAHNVNINYTNQAGTAGRTLPVTVACTASAITPHITHSGTAANNYGPFLPLAAGDTGIRSVQSITLSAASLAGTATLVLYKPLAVLPITTLGVAAERDLMNQLPSLPRLVDGCALSMLYFAGAATGASTNFYGYNDITWG